MSEKEFVWSNKTGAVYMIHERLPNGKLYVHDIDMNGGILNLMDVTAVPCTLRARFTEDFMGPGA